MITRKGNQQQSDKNDYQQQWYTKNNTQLQKGQATTEKSFKKKMDHHRKEKDHDHVENHYHNYQVMPFSQLPQQAHENQDHKKTKENRKKL